MVQLGASLQLECWNYGLQLGEIIGHAVKLSRYHGFWPPDRRAGGQHSTIPSFHVTSQRG